MEIVMKAKAMRSLGASAALGGLVLACSGSSGTVDVVPAGAVSTHVSGDMDRSRASQEPSSVVCDAGDAEHEPEYYRLEPMNRKLKYFPELGEAIGLSKVTSCDGARAFVRGYAEYSAAHPDFDAEQPLEYPEQPLPEAPTEDSGSYEVNKMLNGMANAVNFPVVKIVFRNTVPSDNAIKTQYANFIGSQCTGTFISKNVILTAGHCVSAAAVDWCIQRKFSLANCVPEWFKYSKWTIQFSTFTLTDVWGLADVHPDWFGRIYDPTRALPADHTPGFPDAGASFYNTLIGAQHDVALIHIADDGRLPFDVESNGAKRIALNPPPFAADGVTLTGPLTFYGWGVHPGTDDTMRKSLLTPAFTLNGGAINGRVLTTSDSVLCPGDSGGPLVRSMDVVGNDGQQRPIEAILAVASTGPARPTPTVCPTAAVVGNTDMNWTRVDTLSSRTFITKFIDRFYGPYFRCRERPRAGGPATVMEVAECWGFPCRQPDQCKTQPTGYYCSAAGSLLNQKTCDTCFTQGGGCGCVIGQCLPGPMSTPPAPLPD
jgi:hypothetical protein